MAPHTIIDDLATLPSELQLLFQKRIEARQKKDFARSDELRDQIYHLGYLVSDEPGVTKIYKIGDADLKPLKNFLVMFGSGETAPSSVDIYRQIFLQLGKRNLSIALISTPAGFQPNVDHVYGEIRDFLLSSFPDFNLNIQIISANNREMADDPHIVDKITKVDIIFTGPGSPTYAVKHLRSTLLLQKIIDQVKTGSTLILASAATITFSQHALPVYEIFKVGEDLGWIDGLNVYSQLWQTCSVIPHFNNKEGGSDLDTSYCFIGRGRGEQMLKMLPPEDKFIGIDEHTALIVDLKTQTELVRGKGKVTSLLR